MKTTVTIINMNRFIMHGKYVRYVSEGIVDNFRFVSIYIILNGAQKRQVKRKSVKLSHNSNNQMFVDVIIMLHTHSVSLVTCVESKQRALRIDIVYEVLWFESEFSDWEKYSQKSMYSSQNRLWISLRLPTATATCLHRVYRQLIREIREYHVTSYWNYYLLWAIFLRSVG